MANAELYSPIPEIKSENQPDILAYSLLRNFVADLSPRETTPGMDMWSEFRFRATRETNYPRWSKSFAINGNQHIVALFGVQGEKPGGELYAHSRLRCSCSLPDYKSFTDLEDDYHECPAQDLVIDERVGVYRHLVGAEQLGRLSGSSLNKAAIFLAEIIRNNPLSWPPSHRSDRLLVDRMAEVFDVSKQRMRTSAKELAAEEIVELHGDAHLTMSLAA